MKRTLVKWDISFSYSICVTVIIVVGVRFIFIAMEIVEIECAYSSFRLYTVRQQHNTPQCDNIYIEDEFFVIIK